MTEKQYFFLIFMNKQTTFLIFLRFMIVKSVPYNIFFEIGPFCISFFTILLSFLFTKHTFFTYVHLDFQWVSVWEHHCAAECSIQGLTYVRTWYWLLSSWQKVKVFYALVLTIIFPKKVAIVLPYVRSSAPRGNFLSLQWKLIFKISVY